MTNILTDPNLLQEDPNTPVLIERAEIEENTNTTEEIFLPEGKPSNLPDKFWNFETGSLRLGSMIESYINLEQKLSTMIPSPDTDDGKANILKILGAPERPEDYQIDVSHGFFESDNDINRKMFEKGFTLEQAQAAYDIAADKFVPLILEMAEEFRADREIERLTNEFGGEEKWKEISRQLLAFGQKNLPPEVLSSMASSFEGVMMLFKMMKGQDPDINVSDSNIPVSNGIDGLKEMMKDPRYWRDRDPAFVKKVTEGFKSIY